MTCATEQFITQCSSSRQTETENKEWEENRLGWRPWQAQCVRAFQPAGSYHSDHGRFTLRSLKPLPTATLMKKGIYHTQLQWRTTPKNTKHVCLLMSSCSCNYGSTEWQRQGFTEHIAADSAVAFQLKTHQSLAPLFSPGLHRGAAICHMARSHTPCTQCIQYMNRETNKRKEKKDRTGKKHAVAWTFTQHKTRKHAHVHSLLPPSWARSFLLQQHKSYHAGCQGRERGERGGRETLRKR